MGFGRGGAEVVWPEVVIGGCVAQLVVSGGEDRDDDGADGVLGCG